MTTQDIIKEVYPGPHSEAITNLVTEILEINPNWSRLSIEEKISWLERAKYNGDNGSFI